MSNREDKNMLSRVSEGVALIALPVILIACAIAGIDQTAVVSLIAAVVSLVMFFAGYEWRRPNLRETMPVVVFAALAAAGRILFAPIPDVKPVSAIAIVAGAAFGRQSGFMVGALAALVSNFFFGQGAWTPWQMYAWGLIGWLAGVMASAGIFEKKWTVYAVGFCSGLLYGLLLNLWSMLGFYHPQTFAELVAVWLPAIPFDIVHGISTVVFLGLLWAPWHKKLERLKIRYGLGAST